MRHGGGVGVVGESTGYGSKWLTRTMADGQGPSVLSRQGRMVGERERVGGRERGGREVSTSRFTALTCDAAARAGESGEAGAFYFATCTSFVRGNICM